MVKNLIFSFLFFCLALSTHADKLRAYFTYCTFTSPEAGPYIETYLSVVGESTVYKKNNDGLFQSTTEVTLIFKQGEEIKQFKKYNLLSPLIEDSMARKENFIDQQRIPLPNGDYEFQISIKDLNSVEEPFSSTQILNISYPIDKIGISDIELIESLQKTEKKSILTKSGYDLIPYTSDYYPENFEKIAFYTEVYHTQEVLGKDEDFLITSFIESSESNKLVGSYKSFSREKAKPVNIVLKSFEIKELPSGNYNLVIEVRNKNNDLLAEKKIFFQRSNPSVTPILLSDDYLQTFVAPMTVKELSENIKSIEPISTNIEIDFARNQLKGKDEKLMKQYFYNFWLKRNQTDPEGEWNEYAELVELSNELFSTSIKKGYVTDRGRVFLKYGKPDTRREIKSEPNSYPYEIWHYYNINGFSNKRFVFYSPDLITNEYPLLHSTMPGHIYNAQWKVQLHKRTNQPTDIDEENNSSHYGGRADDYYNNPR